MKSARLILIEHLQRLMVAKGWRKADGEWNISALHAKTGGSRRWLYRLVRGEANFSIDEYDRVLQQGFALPFQAIMTPPAASAIPRDVEDLYKRLTEAIAHARETETLEAVRYGVNALADKAAMDKAIQDKARASPNVASGTLGAPPRGKKKKS